jgi:hypothetical protein
MKDLKEKVEDLSEKVQSAEFHLQKLLDGKERLSDLEKVVKETKADKDELQKVID